MAESLTLPARRGWWPVAAALVIGGWAANQFTPLSVVYRSDEGWQTLPVVVMFTVYLVGLVPALLLGCRAADRFGRRRVVRLALLLEVLASLGLAAGDLTPSAVYGSRLATGVATGAIVSAAAAWLQDLSSDVGTFRGGRRAVYATGAGFALGPVAAGAMAEWLPDPMVLPALVHAGLAAVVLLATYGVPETAGFLNRPTVPSAALGERWEAVTHPRFIGIVLPASPAIFAAVTVAYVVLPPLVIERTRDWAPLFSGVVAAVTLTVGLAIQPVAGWLERGGNTRPTLVAMATVVIGLLVGALAVDRVSPVLVVVAAIILGAGYGLTLESGLAEIRRIASPSSFPTLSAAFQGVAHSGFLAPLLLAIVAGSASYPELLSGLAIVGMLMLVIAATWSVKHVEVVDENAPANHLKESEPWAE